MIKQLGTHTMMTMMILHNFGHKALFQQLEEEGFANVVSESPGNKITRLSNLKDFSYIKLIILYKDLIC